MKFGMLAAVAARLGFAQAPLPTAYTGPWQAGAPPAGWTFAGLGVDSNPGFDAYSNGAARLDSTGDYISIAYTQAAVSVTYWIKSLVFTGGIFQVEQSVDGLDWTPLQTYTQLPLNAEFKTNHPALAARHIRFFYAERVNGNVGLDAISLFPFVQPVIGAFSTTGGVVRVTILQSTLGRTYALEHALALTNNPAAWSAPDDLKTGNDGSLMLRDATPADARRFYRVRDVTP